MHVNNAAIRPMTHQDLDEVLRLEGHCHTHPWSAASFLAELDNPHSRIDLLFMGERLAGFLCASLVCGEMTILDVATDPDFRRRGVAARLLTHVLEQGRQAGLEKVFLEVRIHNAGAIALYRRFGFLEISRRPAYYADGEDALVMQRDEVMSDAGI